MLLRSNSGNQVYGYLEEIDLARFKVMTEGAHLR